MRYVLMVPDQVRPVRFDDGVLPGTPDVGPLSGKVPVWLLDGVEVKGWITEGRCIWTALDDVQLAALRLAGYFLQTELERPPRGDQYDAE